MSLLYRCHDNNPRVKTLKNSYMVRLKELFIDNQLVILPFQFLYGTIKRIVKQRLKMRVLYFNSYMVRLKVF